MNSFRWEISRCTSIQREMQKFEKETMYTPQTEEKGDTPRSRRNQIQNPPAQLKKKKVFKGEENI